MEWQWLWLCALMMLVCLAGTLFGLWLERPICRCGHGYAKHRDGRNHCQVLDSGRCGCSSFQDNPYLPF